MPPPPIKKTSRYEEYRREKASSPGPDSRTAQPGNEQKYVLALVIAALLVIGLLLLLILAIAGYLAASRINAGQPAVAEEDAENQPGAKGRAADAGSENGNKGAKLEPAEDPFASNEDPSGSAEDPFGSGEDPFASDSEAKRKEGGQSNGSGNPSGKPKRRTVNSRIKEDPKTKPTGVKGKAFGIPLTGNTVVYLLETTDNVSGRVRSEMSAGAALSFNGLGASQRFLVSLYNSDYYTMYFPAFLDEPAAATAENQRKAKAWLSKNQLIASGEPNHALAIRAAIRHQPSDLVLVTSSVLSTESVKALAEIQMTKTKLHVVCLGVKGDTSQWKDLAEKSGGGFSKLK